MLLGTWSKLAKRTRPIKFYTCAFSNPFFYLDTAPDGQFDQKIKANLKEYRPNQKQNKSANTNWIEREKYSEVWVLLRQPIPKMFWARETEKKVDEAASSCPRYEECLVRPKLVSSSEGRMMIRLQIPRRLPFEATPRVTPPPPLEREASRQRFSLVLSFTAEITARWERLEGWGITLLNCTADISEIWEEPGKPFNVTIWLIPLIYSRTGEHVNH